MGPYDVTLYLSKASDVGGGQMAIVDQLAVVMSPQHFKQFSRAINETLKAYESVFGALQIPDSDIEPTTKADQIEKMLLEARAKAAAAARQQTTDSDSSSSVKRRPSRRSRAAEKG